MAKPTVLEVFLSIMAVVLLAAVISVKFETYVRDNASPKRIDLAVAELMYFRDELVTYLSDEDIEGARQLLLINPKNSRQFLIFDEYDNEILERERFVRCHFKRHFEHPLSDEFSARGLALQVNVNSYLGQTYFIQILPKMQFNLWLSPRLAGAVLRAVLLLLLTAVVCYVLTRTLTRRIARLQQATYRFASHDFDADVAELHLGNDELGQLGKAFYTMANQLNDSEQKRKQVLSDISHELRSPLARLQVAVEIARLRQKENHDIDPPLARIDAEIERMNTLIGQIIHLQELTAGKVLEAKPLIGLQNLLQTIIDDVNYEYQLLCRSAKLIDMYSDCQILGDKTLLGSAFENIIRNAMSHTHENTEVTVQLMRDMDSLILSVSDCGNGINDDNINDIFQPFVRLDSSRNRETGGYGLGLAIAKAIIESHGGKIFAKNKTQASGLEARVVLPIT